MRITYHKWSSCAIFHFSLFIFHFSVCYWKMKYKVKDTEKWKVKSEKWKAKVKNESHVYVGIGTPRPFFTFHFSFFTFQFVTEKWKPKWKILKNENTKWKVIIDFRNELYLFFILCLKTRNFPVSAPRHTGVMLRAPSLWLRPPYLLVKPLEPYWKASLCEHVHLLKRHLTSTTFNCFGLLRGHVWICPSFGNKRFIPSSIIRSNIMGVHSIMYVFEKMIACTVVAFVPFIVQLVADEAHQQWMYNGLFLAVDN